MSNLTDKAMEALKAGSGFQTEIRGFIDHLVDDGGFSNESAAMSVAAEVGTFRDYAKIWIDSEPSEKKMRTKQTNNICNDVSRITRGMLGYTIKCTQKKPWYQYTATEWTKPERSTTSLTAPVSAAAVNDTEIDDLKAEIETLKEVRNRYREIWKTPESVIHHAVTDWGSETVGRALIEKITNDAALDSDD